MDAAGNLLAYYVHSPGIDEPLAMVRGGQVYYYHADALGTVTHMTNSSGAVVQSYEYDSFGNLTAQSGSITQPYTFTAREWDAETGLYYYRARYYDPQVGRFSTEDPLGFNSGINYYIYAGNAPSNFGDPYGLGPQDEGSPIIGPEPKEPCVPTFHSKVYAGCTLVRIGTPEFAKGAYGAAIVGGVVGFVCGRSPIAAAAGAGVTAGVWYYMYVHKKCYEAAWFCDPPSRKRHCCDPPSPKKQ